MNDHRPAAELAVGKLLDAFMDSLPTFTHPQAVAAAYAVVALTTAWVMAMVGLRHAIHAVREAAPAEPTVRRRRSLA